MEAAAHPAEFKDFLLFLAAAGVVVPLLRVLRVSSVLGFLAVGVMLGPWGLSRLAEGVPGAGLLTISDPEEITILAELGVVLLLFMIGLELSFERLRRMWRQIVGLGGLQVLICAVLIGGVGYLAGARLGAAVTIGLALALSSTAIVMRVLEERGSHTTPSGRLSFSVLLAQDLALIPILFGIAAVAGRYEADFSEQLLGTYVPAALIMAGMILGSRLLLRPLLGLAARSKSRELFVAACLFVVLVTGALAQAAGLSMGLGAFVAGLLLAETEYHREVEVTLDPFKGLFLGAFFLSVGIQLNLGLLLREPLLVLGVVLGMMLLKAAVITGLARLFGAPLGVALQSGMLLAAGGEFAFVILSGAQAADLIEPGPAQLALVAATLSMFTIPLWAWLADKLGKLASHQAASAAMAQTTEADEGPRVLVVGFGRVGQLVAEMLSRHDQPFLAIDNDPDSVQHHREQKVPVLYGDATRPELLARCGLKNAKALVITFNNPAAVEGVVVAARSVRPDLTIVARARDDLHAARLYEIGVTDAVPETVEASLQLAENTLVDVGVPMGWVIASIHERREEFRALFREKIEGDREPRAMRSAQNDEESRRAMTRDGAQPERA